MTLAVALTAQPCHWQWRPETGALHYRVAGRSLPRRTCVGCRVRAAKTDLLRVVAVEGACVPDPGGRLPGRGAHLHPESRCLDLAERRRAFPRALRLPGPLDLSAVRAYVECGGRSGADAEQGVEQEAREKCSTVRTTVESGSGSRRE